ncbi:hypothetical protein ACGFYQ_21920 [Streptomyces sp. NPDC048258]|uniref:hypothetical protein n=1 Tax=Streptomyces sp. NPDC048258 TaxID=3365527 RepID=UPI0037191409
MSTSGARPCWSPGVSRSHPRRLSNRYGNHWALNNQYGGATANLCTASNGGGCGSPIAAMTGVHADLTPINSIRLNRP